MVRSSQLQEKLTPNVFTNPLSVVVTPSYYRHAFPVQVEIMIQTSQGLMPFWDSSPKRKKTSLISLLKNPTEGIKQG